MKTAWAGMTARGRRIHIAVTVQRGQSDEWVTACRGVRISDSILEPHRRKRNQQVVLPAGAVKPHARCKACPPNQWLGPVPPKLRRRTR